MLSKLKSLIVLPNGFDVWDYILVCIILLGTVLGNSFGSFHSSISIYKFLYLGSCFYEVYYIKDLWSVFLITTEVFLFSIIGDFFVF